MSIDVLVKASGLLLLPIYLKLMTQEEFGIYSYAIGLSSFLALVGSMCVYSTINRYFYDRKYSKKEVVSTLFLILVLSVTILAIFLFLSMYVWMDFAFGDIRNSTTICVLIIVTIFHGALDQFFTSLFYIDKKYKEIQRFNLVRLVLVNCISLSAMFIFSQNSVIERLSALIVSELLVCILFFKCILQYFSIIKFNKDLAIQGIIFGYPVALNAILGFIYSFADKYFIQSIFNFSLLGEYSFMLTFASIFTVLFSSIHNFWFSFFFNPDNSHLLSHKLAQLIGLLFVAAIIFYFVVLFLIKSLFDFNIFNSIYRTGISYLWLLVSTQFITSINALFNNYFSLYNKTIYGLYVSMISLFTSILIIYIFVNKYQAYGAAIASTINSIISLILTIVFIRYLKARLC